MKDLSDSDRYCPACDGRGYHTDESDGCTHFYDCWMCAGTGGSGPVIVAPAAEPVREHDSEVAGWFSDAAGMLCLVIALVGGMHFAGAADPRSDTCIMWGEC